MHVKGEGKHESDEYNGQERAKYTELFNGNQKAVEWSNESRFSKL